MIIRILLSFLGRVMKSVGVAAITPVLEKNVVKTLATNSALVISMSRLIVVAFAAVMLKQFWHSGINGWPDAALGIAVVLALPVMSSLEHANPDEILAVTRLLLARFGPPSGAEPTKLDDHRTD
jgi:hypothetical protein